MDSGRGLGRTESPRGLSTAFKIDSGVVRQNEGAVSIVIQNRLHIGATGKHGMSTPHSPEINRFQNLL